VLGDAAFSQSDDHPCSGISARSMTRGQVEVWRSGPTGGTLVVRYAATGADADHGPLSGEVTIPAGAASAVIFVDPVFVDVPGPRHEHRSSAVHLSLVGDGAYVPGPASTATVGLRFDIDVFGCDRPAPPGPASPTATVS
jgi:hypothetical protein